MQTEITALTGILILAALVESLVEYLVRPLVKPWVTPGAGAEPPSPVEPAPEEVDWRALLLRYVAASTGILLCCAFQVDLLAYAGLQSPYPWIGQVITGFIVGRGANFVHDFASRWLGAAGTG